MLINDYNSLVKNNKNSHDKGIEFIDETFSMEYDNDRLYVNYHSLDIEILKDDGDIYLSFDNRLYDIYRISSLLDIIRFRISYLNLRCRIYIEDNTFYFAISKKSCLS
jgi:hypothetical protein